MAFLSKPTLLFLTFNALRLLSVVGLCLVFASEIVTINSDVKGMRAARAADEAKGIVPGGGGETTRPSNTMTASIKLVKRAQVSPPSDLHLFSSSSSPPTISALSPDDFDIHAAAAATGSSPTVRFVKRVQRPVGQGSSSSPRQHGRLALYRDGDGLLARAGIEGQRGNAGLEKRDPAVSESSSTTRRPTSSTSTRSTPPGTATTTATTTTSPKPGPTATNAPLGRGSADETQAASSSCAYIGETSIPKGAGGALFSTLERIFASLILLLMLFSELCPPFPPLSKPARLIDRFWGSFFPPFSDHYGVGVLGAVEVFVSCQVLSHPTKGWIQISSWYLFIIGILNMLAGLAFGARLKVIRSLGGDSTTPSALRQLRLTAATSTGEKPHDAAPAAASGPSPRTETLEYSQPFGGGSTRCLVSTAAAAAAAAASHGPSHASELQEEQHQATKPRFFPFANLTASSASKEGKKKHPIQSKGTVGVSTRSRNGPNGIIISAPIRPVSDAEQPPVVSSPYNHPPPPPPPPPVYHRGQ
ncbi:hypothetical protein RHOSPDRAFT_33956 [Rhodotorula sp. JG-1b]|nr:hypothetical protein RHOSPDRAFT_33956 [Rhodotorula sp. JG-1b]